MGGVILYVPPSHAEKEPGEMCVILVLQSDCRMVPISSTTGVDTGVLKHPLSQDSI